MLQVDRTRLRSRLEAMGDIGRDPAGGRSRLAASDADREGRERFVSWMREVGLSVRVDDLGNVYGRRAGSDEGAPAVMIGSHLDTVPQGGVFDGAMGVLTGLEVLETLNGAGVRTRYPLEVASFTNEEGARFEPSIVGSGTLAGVFDREYTLSRAARDTGATLGDELRRIGYEGERANRPGPLRAFIEYHVEQGPVLEREGLACGVVEGVVGFSWSNVVLHGQTDHAGPTPMEGRRDTMVAAGRIAASLRDLARWIDPELVATVGRLTLSPDVINAIPGRCEFGLDLRHPDQDTLARAVALAHRMVDRIAVEERLGREIEEIRFAPPVPFDPSLIDTLSRVADDLGVPYRRMVSGAGHDAEYMARLAPTAMIFAPSRAGKSHSPEEWTDWEDVYAGADVVLNAAMHLAESVS